MLKIGKANPNPYLSNKETEYISTDNPIETGVLAAHINQFKANQRPSKELIKWIFYWQIEKKNNYAISKNIRFEE